jgi:predicted ATPase/DNA-binding winged helix-turn-helix (wHTH) protein
MASNRPALEIDLEEFQIRKGDQIIRLTEIEVKLLRMLMQHKNRVVSQQELLKEVWGAAYGEENNYLYNYIGRLRKKLGDSADDPKYLLTVPGIGYQWNASEDVVLASKFNPSGKRMWNAVAPSPHNAFIGRERELAMLERKLQKKDVRLLTVTGSGGIGKTRLVLELASRLGANQPFADGIHFVDLAPLDNPDFVIGEIAHVFGLRDKAAVDSLSALKSYLYDKNLLLILDNFEHVMPAVDQMLEILTSSRGTKVLITSRARLDLYGEQNLELQPMALSGSAQDQIDCASEAVQLFVERAQAIDPHFELTPGNAPILHQICERLDGLALAIELAAIMIDRFTPSALLEQLDRRLAVLVDGQRNLPLRHQTLRAAIDCSYELLDGHERRLFVALSVFNGSFTKDAAAAIFSIEALAAAQIGNKLISLHHKSLLSRKPDPNGGEASYAMLGILKEYAADRLTNDERSQLGRRHADYFLNLLEAHNRSPAGATSPWPSSNLDNLRAAMQWAMINHAGEIALRIGVGMDGHWQRMGRLREGKQWLFNALDAAADCPMPLRARALHCAGALADWLGEHHTAQGMYRESLRLYEMLEDEPGITHGLLILGSALINQGDFVEGRSLSEQSLGMAREQKDPIGVERALNNLGMIAIYQADALKARSIYDEMLSRCESRKNAQGKAWALTGLSWVALLQGNYAVAQRLIMECLLLHQQTPDILGTALALTCDSWIALYRADFDEAVTKLNVSLNMCQNVGLANLSIWPLTGLARISLHRGDLQQAHSLLGEALRLCEALNFPPVTAWVYLALGIEYRLSGQYQSAFDEFDRALTLSRKRDDRNALVAALEQFATLFAAQDRFDGAVQLFGTAAQRRETHALPLSKLDRLEYDQVVRRVQNDKRADWETNWLKGQSLEWTAITGLIHHRPDVSGSL